MTKIAVIDVGSYTVRLLVAEVDRPGRTWRAVLYGRRVTNLGLGLASGQGLDPDAVQATTEAVAELAARARAEGAEFILPRGTAALRDASGAQHRAAIEALSRAAGAPVVILSGPDEARLSFLGMRPALGDFGGGWLVFDLGGRSLELTVIPPGPDQVLSAGSREVEAVSLELGALSLTGLFVKSDPPRPGEVSGIQARVQSVLASMGPDLKTPADPPARLAGTGGTVSTLGLLEAGLREYEPGAVQGVFVSRDRIGHWLGVLGRATEAQRRLVLGPAAERAPVIVAGVAVVAGLVRWFDADGVKVIESGLLEGVIEDFLRKTPAER
jgi:exopolyphosphatase/guanosine-5'-triphosphate,3'-diphosphate pyrophosphatase